VTNITIVFWNIHGKRLFTQLTNIVGHYEVDLLMLAECPGKKPEDREDYCLELAKHLATTTHQPYRCLNNPNGYVKFLTRLPKNVLPKNPQDSGRVSSVIVQSEKLGKLLVVGVHLPSLYKNIESNQRESIKKASQDIIGLERKQRTIATLVAGDFNSNPFSEALISASGFHAMPSKAIVAKGSRRIAKREYKFFYNPMWNFFGDQTPGPPGSYYYRQGGDVCYFWNIFDQVLIRPELLAHFHDGDVQILDNDDGSGSSLLKNGFPDKGIASDHLPLLFKVHSL
jgi:endonuclease/exonuclease/phosphatase family metal-dependent hydrolase